MQNTNHNNNTNQKYKDRASKAQSTNPNNNTVNNNTVNNNTVNNKTLNNNNKKQINNKYMPTVSEIKKPHNLAKYINLKFNPEEWIDILTNYNMKEQTWVALKQHSEQYAHFFNEHSFSTQERVGCTSVVELSCKLVKYPELIRYYKLFNKSITNKLMDYFHRFIILNNILLGSLKNSNIVNTDMGSEFVALLNKYATSGLNPNLKNPIKLEESLNVEHLKKFNDFIENQKRMQSKINAASFNNAFGADEYLETRNFLDVELPRIFDDLNNQFKICYNLYKKALVLFTNIKLKYHPSFVRHHDLMMYYKIKEENQQKPTSLYTDANVYLVFLEERLFLPNDTRYPVIPPAILDKTQPDQLNTYISEHLILKRIIDYHDFTIAPRNPFKLSDFPVSMLLNQQASKIFGYSMSKTTFSRLLTYCQNCTQILQNYLVLNCVNTFPTINIVEQPGVVIPPPPPAPPAPSGFNEKS